MIEGGLDNLDKVDAGDVDAEEPLEVVKMGGEGVDRNEGVVVVVVVVDDGVVVADASGVVVVVVVGVMIGGKLEVVAIGMSLTLATLGV
jgi:hypothetical protein